MRVTVCLWAVSSRSPMSNLPIELDPPCVRCERGPSSLCDRGIYCGPNSGGCIEWSEWFRRNWPLVCEQIARRTTPGTAASGEGEEVCEVGEAKTSLHKGLSGADTHVPRDL